MKLKEGAGFNIFHFVIEKKMRGRFGFHWELDDLLIILEHLMKNTEVKILTKKLKEEDA